MTFSYEILLLLLLLVTAAGAIMVKDLLSSVLLLGSYSFFLALVWAWLGAVDVAFVEAVVGAGLATVLFLLTLFGTDPKDTRLRRPPPSLAKLIVFPLLGVLLLYAASDLPGFGDPNSPASIHISPTYLEQSYQDTLTPNVVTSVLMDYRSLDTMVETVVIFFSGYCLCFAVEERYLMIRPHDSIIVQTLGRFLIPVVQIFGLYVLFFGQYGPGGGFVGGVILGTSMILSVFDFWS